MLWSLLEPGKLSKQSRDVLENPKVNILVSTISFWELSLKYSIGKLDLIGGVPEDILDAARATGFTVLELEPDVVIGYHQLPKSQENKDPFDRMLVWEAIQMNVPLISKDKRLAFYRDHGLEVYW